ncbi:MAG: substrate-binding domain-containing protein [Bryobacteraceae bacterium]
MKKLTLFPLTLLLGLAACSGSRHDPNEKYYLLMANTKVAYWQTASSGLVQGVRALGVLGEIDGPDTYDPKAEAQEFRDVIAKKPGGILVSAADPDLMKGPIDDAIAKGIPVITIDSDSPKSQRLCFIGTNNYQAGLMGGRVLVDRLHDKGEVIVYTMPGQANLDERLQGYKNILADHPQIKITRIVDVKGDPRIAFDTTKDILTKDKIKPDGFVCLESTSCPEVADVLDREKVAGKVVIAMDTNTDTLQWIQKGVIAATIAQKPFTMAYYGVVMLDALHHNKPPTLARNWAQDTFSPIPVFVDTGATLIDKSNLDAFQQAQSSTAPAAK